jgi:hypothetical protein
MWIILQVWEDGGQTGISKGSCFHSYTSPAGMLEDGCMIETAKREENTFVPFREKKVVERYSVA